MRIDGLTPPSVLDVYDFVSRKGLLNLSLNIAGLLDNKKDVSVWLNGKEVLTGNFIANAFSALDTTTTQRASSVIGLNAVVLDLEVDETSKIMEHPIESGVVIADHKVINPVEARLRLTMPVYEYEPVIKELRGYYENGTKLSIHSKAHIYDNMVVCDIPHSETPRNVSRLTFTIRLKQALVVMPQYIRLPKSAVKKPKNADTLKSGIKQGQTVQTSVLEDIVAGLKNWFSKRGGNATSTTVR